MKKITFISFVLLLTANSVLYGQTTWNPYSYDITFKIKNAGLTVTGRFATVKASIKFTSDKLSASSLMGVANVATIKTGIDKRDKDLQEEQYFNTEKYKLIEITSTKLYVKGAQYAGLFNVTIKGVTKQIEIPFEFNQLGAEAELKGAFTIDRKDFGVGGKSMIMGDNVDISIDIKAKN